MSDFMQPQVIQEDFIEYEEAGERWVVPADVESIIKNEGFEITERYHDKWFARLSAPGYLDCTDWQGPYDTEEEALQDLIERYGLTDSDI